MNDNMTLQEIINRAFLRIQRLEASRVATIMLLTCLLEQLPHSKATLFAALTRHFDALNQALDDGSAPDTELHAALREEMDHVMTTFCRT